MKTKQSQLPLISVILPISNAASFLPTSLESLLTQNYKNIEIIAVDDFSTDISYAIVKGFKKNDKRIKLFHNVKKYGLAITLNRAIRRAKGKFLVFMDARDMVTKNKFQKQLQYIQKNPKAVVVGTQCVYLNDDNKRIGKSNYPEMHEHISQSPLHGVSMLFEGVMINRFRIPKDLLYFPTAKHFFLYSDMAVKLIQFGEITNLPEYLHFHRKHSSTTLSTTTKHAYSLMKLWLSSKFDYEIEALSLKNLFTGFLKANTSSTTS